jgi:hypothetical protein
MDGEGDAPGANDDASGVAAVNGMRPHYEQTFISRYCHLRSSQR